MRARARSLDIARFRCECAFGQPSSASGHVDQVVSRDRRERRDVAELGWRRVVPEQAIASTGDDERDVDDGVSLPEVEVEAFDIQLAFLALTEAVEGLVRIRLPDLLNVVGVGALHRRGHQASAAGGFRQKVRPA